MKTLRIERRIPGQISNEHKFFYRCPFEAHYISKFSGLRGESHDKFQMTITFVTDVRLRPLYIKILRIERRIPRQISNDHNFCYRRLFEDHYISKFS